MERQLASLRRQVRWMQVLTVGAMALVVSFGMAPPASGPSEPQAGPKRFDEITVSRLNIAGPDGVNRIVLSHTMPQAPFGGEMFPRSVPPGMAGMIFCAANGDEVGGIGVSGDEKSGHALVTLDYRNTPLEAVGLTTHFGPQGHGAGLVIMDNPTGRVDLKKLKAEDPAEVARLQEMMINRLSLSVASHDASLVIRDRQGRPRIRIGVDAKNRPHVAVLDEEGRETATLPAR